MKTRHMTTAAGLAIVLALAVAAQAANITYVGRNPFDPTKTAIPDYRAEWKSYDDITAYYLTWSGYTAQGLFDPSGKTTTAWTKQANPAWLSFQGDFGPGSGGQGTGSGNQTWQTVYTLGNNEGTDWSMDFYMLFYDPTFGNDPPAGITPSVKVEISGTVKGDNNVKEETLTLDEVKAGTMLDWKLEAAAGEQVFVLVTATGDQTYPVAFLMDDTVHGGVQNPEPASLGLLGVGLAAALFRRRRRATTRAD